VLTDEGLWQRVDPSQWASNAGTALGTARLAGLGLLQQLVDTLSYHWVQAVVVFDLNQQLALWRAARNPWRDYRLADLWQWGGFLVGAGVVGALGVVLLAVRRRRPGRPARLLAALHARARKRLGRETALENMGLSELAERLDSDSCREFARIYQGAVFRDRALTATEFRRLKALLREI
jgi:hypothetical protein